MLFAVTNPIVFNRFEDNVMELKFRWVVLPLETRSFTNIPREIFCELVGGWSSFVLNDRKNRSSLKVLLASESERTECNAIREAAFEAGIIVGFEKLETCFDIVEHQRKP